MQLLLFESRYQTPPSPPPPKKKRTKKVIALHLPLLHDLPLSLLVFLTVHRLYMKSVQKRANNN